MSAARESVKLGWSHFSHLIDGPGHQRRLASIGRKAYLAARARRVAFAWLAADDGSDPSTQSGGSSPGELVQARRQKKMLASRAGALATRDAAW